MKRLIAALCLAAATAAPSFAQGQWRKVGSYSNGGVYSTNIEARLLSKKWDSLRESYVVVFQLNAQGKDVGAMEFDVLCKNGAFVFERKIVVPTTGARVFSSGAAPHFQKAKIRARGLYC